MDPSFGPGGELDKHSPYFIASQDGFILDADSLITSEQAVEVEVALAKMKVPASFEPWDIVIFGFVTLELVVTYVTTAWVLKV